MALIVFPSRFPLYRSLLGVFFPFCVDFFYRLSEIAHYSCSPNFCSVPFFCVPSGQSTFVPKSRDLVFFLFPPRFFFSLGLKFTCPALQTPPPILALDLFLPPRPPLFFLLLGIRAGWHLPGFALLPSSDPFRSPLYIHFFTCFFFPPKNRAGNGLFLRGILPPSTRFRVLPFFRKSFLSTRLFAPRHVRYFFAVSSRFFVKLADDRFGIFFDSFC